MLYIGLDLSDKHFDSCITNEYGDVLKRNKLNLDQDGFCCLTKLIQELCQEYQAQKQESIAHKGASDCIIGLENPRSVLVDFLIHRGYHVMLTQPNAISNYRKSRKPSGTKSDQGDAQLIADYVREHHKSLRSINIPDDHIRELSLLLEDRDRLVQEKVRLSHQLTSTLKEYFPQALEAFGSIDNKSTLGFLKLVDTYHQVKGTSTKKLEKLLDESGVHRKDSREKFHQAMKNPGYKVSPALVRAKVRLKNALVGHLELLVNQIQEYDHQIEKLMDNSTDGDLFRSLPGADYILGGKILVLYASRDFQNASEAQELFGTAPYTSTSGQSRRVGFRKAANKFGRNTFQQLARGSTRTSKWAKIQYVKKREQGKKSQHAFRCLANTWVKITFAMWRSKTPYDENRHMASITTHMLNQQIFVNND
jgi:transposase